MKPREIPIGLDIERMSDSAQANSPGACVSEWCNYNGLTARRTAMPPAPPIDARAAEML